MNALRKPCILSGFRKAFLIFDPSILVRFGGLSGGCFSSVNRPSTSFPLGGNAGGKSPGKSRQSGLPTGFPTGFPAPCKTLPRAVSFGSEIPHNHCQLPRFAYRRPCRFSLVLLRRFHWPFESFLKSTRYATRTVRSGRAASRKPLRRNAASLPSCGKSRMNQGC